MHSLTYTVHANAHKGTRVLAPEASAQSQSESPVEAQSSDQFLKLPFESRNAKVAVTFASTDFPPGRASGSGLQAARNGRKPSLRPRTTSGRGGRLRTEAACEAVEAKAAGEGV